MLGGLNAYEVIGAYRGDGDAAFLFRLADHLERLRRSAHVMRLPPHGYTDEELRSAVNSVAAASGIINRLSMTRQRCRGHSTTAKRAFSWNSHSE